VSRDIFSWIKVLRAPSNQAWNISRDGASTTYLDNLFQCFTTLHVKIFFLLSSLNLHSLSLKLCSLSYHSKPCWKYLTHILYRPLLVLAGCSKISAQPSVPQAEQPQLFQPSLTGEVLQPLDHLCGPLLASLQQLHVLLVLGASELDAGLQLGSHQGRAEG